jgi:23S rRNA (uracil1939-C5)-methyltransferase
MEIRIHGLTADGSGVGRLPDGRVLFVPRTAPGDQVRVRVTEMRKRWGRGALEAVLDPSPDRQVAPCPRYDRCGGCTLQHLDPAAALAHKKTRVQETLLRIGGFSELPEVEVVPTPRVERYRNRATFTLVRRPEGRVIAGFHDRENPGRIVDVGAECLLLEAPVAQAWVGIREGWGPGAHHLPAGPQLRLTVRGAASGEALLLIEGGTDPGRPERLLEAVEGLRAIWWIPSGAEPGARPIHLGGRAEVEEEAFGERLPIRPGAFLQVNRWGAAALHARVVEEMTPGDGAPLLDAYCGFGAYGRTLAKHGHPVIGIEGSPEAVEMARTRPVEGFRILAGRVEDRMDEALPVQRAILNPPRQGVADGVMPAMGSGVATRIVYVSCDPATLARDLTRLPAAFRLTRLQVVDLFPLTAHVETIATLDRIGRT